MKRKFFLKRLLSISRLMIIPNVLLLLVIGFIVLGGQKNTVEELNERYCEISSMELRSSIHNMGVRIDSMLIDPSQRLRLKELLGEKDHRSQADQVFVTLLKRVMQEYETSYPFVESVYIYLDKAEKYFSSDNGQIVFLEYSSDQQWYDLYMQEPGTHEITLYQRMFYRNIYDKPKMVISFFYPLSNMDGVVVLNVDKDKWLEAARANCYTKSQTVFMSDREGNISVSTDPAMDASDMQMFLQKHSNDIFGTSGSWLKLPDGKYYHLKSIKTEGFEQYLVSCIPLSYMLQNCLPYAWLMCLILIVNIALVVLLSYRYTQQSFHYIEEYISIFSSAERGEEIHKDVIDAEDEYGVILNNIIFMYLQNNRMKQELLEKHHQNEITEMKALQLQINPHFIFNTLQIMDFECIRSLGADSGLHHMLNDLIKILKYSVSSPTDYVTLREEINYLEAYLSIARNRHKNRFITYFEVDDDVMDEKVFKLMLQPIVENSFKHGLTTDGTRMVICIKAERSGDMLHLAVEDNGKGMPPEKLQTLIATINDDRTESIGLTNLHRRIKIHYGEEYGLKIESEVNKGTVVSMDIPIQNSI